MKVKRLIEILQEHDPEMLVVVDGYEDGFDDLSQSNITIVDIALNVHEPSYNGEHAAYGHFKDFIVKHLKNPMFNTNVRQDVDVEQGPTKALAIRRNE